MRDYNTVRRELQAYSEDLIKKDEVMAKEIGIKQLTPEQRIEMDKIMASRPEISRAELISKIGVNLGNSPFQSMKFAIRNGKWNFKHLAQAPAKPAVSRVVSGHTNGHIPFVNYTKISSPQILGSIQTEGYSPQEIKFIATRLPSILAELLDKRFAFKVYKYSEYEGENEVERLEFRRVQ